MCDEGSAWMLEIPSPGRGRGARSLCLLLPTGQIQYSMVGSCLEMLVVDPRSHYLTAKGVCEFRRSRGVPLSLAPVASTPLGRMNARVSTAKPVWHDIEKDEILEARLADHA